MKIKKNEVSNESKAVKVFSNIQLIYFVLFLLSLGVIIISLSGILDSSVTGVVVKNQTNETNNSDADADSNVLKQIKEYEEHLKQNPNDYQALLQFGHLLNDNAYFEEAIQKYTQFLMIYPQEADVLVDMGVCYFSLRDYTNAIKSMEKAVDINPNHQIASLNLGIVYFSNNNKEKAIQWWQKAVGIDPNSDAGQKATKLLNSN